MTIGAYAFAGCTGLSGDLSLPSGVNVIGDRAFQNCSGLTHLFLPVSVYQLGEGAFAFCRSLDSFTVPPALNEIPAMAFAGCESLKSIDFPQGLFSIGNDAFLQCSGLKSIVLPNVVQSIGNSAFRLCTGLKSLALPGDLTSISWQTFSGCSSLQRIILPAGITSVEYGAFGQCTALAEVYFAGTEEQWTGINIGEDNDPLLSAAIHFGYAGEALTPIEPDELLFLPLFLTELQSEAFAGVAALAIVIPRSVTSIAGNAFAGSRITLVYGYPGSAAQSFLADASGDTGITFVPIDDDWMAAHGR